MICVAGGRVLGGGVGGGCRWRAFCEVYCHHHKNLTHENKSKGNKIKPFTNKQKGHHTIPCQLAEVTQ